MEVSCAQRLIFGTHTECAVNIFWRRGLKLPNMVYSVTNRNMSQALETGVHNAWGSTTKVAALQ